MCRRTCIWNCGSIAGPHTSFPDISKHPDVARCLATGGSEAAYPTFKKTNFHASEHAIASIPRSLPLNNAAKSEGVARFKQN